MKTFKVLFIFAGISLINSYGMAMEPHEPEVRRHRKQRSCSAPIKILKVQKKSIIEELATWEKIEKLLYRCTPWEMLSEEEISFLEKNGYNQERYVASIAIKPRIQPVVQPRNYSCPVTPRRDSQNPESRTINLDEIEARLREMQQKRLQSSHESLFAPPTLRLMSLREEGQRRYSEPTTPVEYDEWDMGQVVFGEEPKTKVRTEDEIFNGILDDILKISKKQLARSNQDFEKAYELRCELEKILEDPRLQPNQFEDENHKLVIELIHKIIDGNYNIYWLTKERKRILFLTLESKRFIFYGYGKKEWERHGGLEWERKEQNLDLQFVYREMQKFFSQAQPVTIGSSE